MKPWVKMLVFCILSFFVSFPYALAINVASVEKFLDNAAFDAWDPNSNDLLFLRKDEKGVLQIFKVRENSINPESDKVCISCNAQRAVGSSYPQFL